MGQPALADVVPLRDVLLAADDADLQADAGKVVVAVAISLLAGLYANDILDNARIFGLLPFFVLGLKMHEGHWNLLAHAGARGGTASRCWSALLRARLVLRARWIETEWLYYRSRYDSLDPTTCAPS